MFSIAYLVCSTYYRDRNAFSKIRPTHRTVRGQPWLQVYNGLSGILTGHSCQRTSTQRNHDRPVGASPRLGAWARGSDGRAGSVEFGTRTFTERNAVGRTMCRQDGDRAAAMRWARACVTTKTIINNYINNTVLAVR